MSYINDVVTECVEDSSKLMNDLTIVMNQKASISEEDEVVLVNYLDGEHFMSDCLFHKMVLADYMTALA